MPKKKKKIDENEYVGGDIHSMSIDCVRKVGNKIIVSCRYGMYICIYM